MAAQSKVGLLSERHAGIDSFDRGYSGVAEKSLIQRFL